MDIVIDLKHLYIILRGFEVVRTIHYICGYLAASLESRSSSPRQALLLEFNLR